MAEGLLTEWEWRKQSARVRRPAVKRCWGAQCMLGKPRPPITQNRAFHALLVMLSFTAALLMPLAMPVKSKAPEYGVVQVQAAAESGPAVRSLSAVDYARPQGLKYVTQTYTREELLRGKLLLIDEAHPLPKGVPAPNTMSVATYGKGMVPVSDLTVKSGKETITALSRLFAELRGRGAGGFAVCRATMTPWEQREWRMDTLRTLSGVMPLADAMANTLAICDAPYTGELQQEYAVDICLMDNASNKESQRPLEHTEQGRTLLQTAWRHGFIHSAQERGHAGEKRLRYVGEAHATAMTYLDLTLNEYIELLHQKRELWVRRDDHVSYLILCQPMNGAYAEFQLPKDAAWEASLDNAGYAVVACAIQLCDI